MFISVTQNRSQAIILFWRRCWVTTMRKCVPRCHPIVFSESCLLGIHIENSSRPVEVTCPVILTVATMSKLPYSWVLFLEASQETDNQDGFGCMKLSCPCFVSYKHGCHFSVCVLKGHWQTGWNWLRWGLKSKVWAITLHASTDIFHHDCIWWNRSNE